MAKTLRSSIGITVALLGAVLFAGGAWPVAAEAAAPASPTVKVAQNTALGTILTDGRGMTLYTFKKDKPGVSACKGACASVWPPLTVSRGMQPLAGPGIPAKLGEIRRQDGTDQVTYNGLPLYRYTGDHKPGDMNGQGFANLWSVVPTTTATAAAGGAPSTGW